MDESYIIVDTYCANVRNRYNVLAQNLTEKQIKILEWAEYDNNDITEAEADALTELLDYLDYLGCDCPTEIDPVSGKTIYKRPNNVKNMYTIIAWA
jgi:hypothetical protein